MKTGLIALILSFVLAFSPCALADSPDFSIEVGNEYTAAYESSDKGDIATLMNMSKKAADAYFKEHDIKYFAVKNDRSVQLSLSVYSNDLSELTGDSSSLDDDSLAKLADSLSEGSGSESAIYVSNGIKYLVFTDSLSLSDGKPCVSNQYFTVSNGKIYQLTFFSSGNKQSSDVEKIVSTFKITKNSEKTPASLLPILLVIFGLAIFASLSIVMIVGIVKRLREKKAEEDNNYKSIV